MLVLEIEENDEEVLRELEKAQKQVGKLSHDTKIVAASGTKLSEMTSSVTNVATAAEPASPGRGLSRRPARHCGEKADLSQNRMPEEEKYTKSG